MAPTQSEQELWVEPRSLHLGRCTNLRAISHECLQLLLKVPEHNVLAEMIFCKQARAAACNGAPFGVGDQGA